MIAAWMLYCTLCAAALGVVALLAERALLGGGAVRTVWVAAVVLSFVIPAIAYRAASRTITPVATPTANPTLAIGTALDQAVETPSTVAETTPVASTRWNWRTPIRAIARANGVAIDAWAAVSVALALYFVVGVVALARMRRRWERRSVLGFSVLVSDRTGPAVVGAISPAIVMPSWALNMEQSQLALMLRHEDEHLRANDVQLMTAAQLVLIAMPWNAALWWLMVRLGMAVELDCDARVLRDADARSYGDLLLEVARPRRGPRLIGATAFAERAEQLERRIRAITRGRARASRRARAAAALAGLAVASMAWVAPRPPVPSRAASNAIAPIATSNAEQPNAAEVVASGPSATKTTELGPDLAKRIKLPPLRVAAAKEPSGFAPVASAAVLSAPSVPAFQPSPLDEDLRDERDSESDVVDSSASRSA